MNSHITRYFSILFCCLLVGCTPKVVETTVKTEVVTPPKVDENLSDCPKFSDSSNSDEVESNYVIYRDFLKAQVYDQAFALWQKVYEEAPAADGKRNTVFEDGIWFYKRIYTGEEDPETKKTLENTILTFYDEMAECYGEKEWVGARKAFDLYYTFGAEDKNKIYNLFKNYVDSADLKTQAFVFNPFTALLIELHDAGEIPLEEAQKYEAKIREIITHNLENTNGQEKEAWEVVESYAPLRLDEFEAVRGFFDCDYFHKKFYSTYLESPTDCDVMLNVLSKLKFGGCTRENSADYESLLQTYISKCREPKNPCYKFLQNAEYKEAISCFEEKVNNSSDPAEQAKFSFLIAKIYYSHLKNFSKARTWAEKAAGYKSGWGEPYLLIGRLYASSGPKCGSGRGWNSQVVTWVAIDMWNKAKSIDPSTAAEANKFINQYSKYMPDKGDIFQRTLKEGDTYFVPCWIQRRTTIRAAK